MFRKYDFLGKDKKTIREWGKVIIGLATLKTQVVVGQAQAQAAVGYIILDELDARTTARAVQENSSNDGTDPLPSRYAHYNDGADPSPQAHYNDCADPSLSSMHIDYNDGTDPPPLVCTSQ